MFRPEEIKRQCRSWVIVLALACLAALSAALLAPTARAKDQQPRTKDNAASAPAYQVLDSDLTALRQRFNQDAGHPRILMLLSPT